jgi:hypothetical protein
MPGISRTKNIEAMLQKRSRKPEPEEPQLSCLPELTVLDPTPDPLLFQDLKKFYRKQSNHCCRMRKKILLKSYNHTTILNLILNFCTIYSSATLNRWQAFCNASVWFSLVSFSDTESVSLPCKIYLSRW